MILFYIYKSDCFVIKILNLTYYFSSMEIRNVTQNIKVFYGEQWHK